MGEHILGRRDYLKGGGHSAEAERGPKAKLLQLDAWVPSLDSFAGLERLLTCRVLVPEQCNALCSPRRSSIVLMGRTLAPKSDKMVYPDSAFGPFLARVPPSEPILT